MASKNPPRASDALQLLAADHRGLEALFAEFAGQPDAGKAPLIEKVCKALSAHTQLEESLFYPAVQDVIESANLVEEARVEHDSVKQLISKLQSGMLDNAARDATFTVMARMVLDHIGHEEQQLFPLVRQTSLDLQALGHRLQEQRASLQENPVLVS
jgi:hemerythrin superfamily protein